MATNYGGRRDPQDPVNPGSGYPGQAVGPQYGPRILPNTGEIPRRGAPPPPAPPSAFPPRTPQEYAALMRWSLVGSLEHAGTRDLLQRFFEETARQFIAPVTLPPWVYPPFNSTPLGGSGSVTAGNGTYGTLVSGRVPMGSWGCLRLIGQDTQNVAAGTGIADWTNLVWNVAVGPSLTSLVSVPTYDDFSQQIGQVEAPTDCYIFVPEGNYFAFRVKATGGAAISGCAGVIRGWSWLIRGGRLDGSAKGVMGD